MTDNALLRDVHGTYSSYNLGKCRCVLCRDANRRYMQAHRARLAEEEVPDRVHGTVNGFSNYGCRCVDCRIAGYRAAAEKWAERAERLEDGAAR